MASSVSGGPGRGFRTAESYARASHRDRLTRRLDAIAAEVASGLLAGRSADSSVSVRAVSIARSITAAVDGAVEDLVSLADEIDAASARDMSASGVAGRRR